MDTHLVPPLPEALSHLPVASRLHEIDFNARFYMAKAATASGKSLLLAPHEAMLRKQAGGKGCMAMRCPTLLTGHLIGSAMRSLWSPLGLKVATLNRDVVENSPEENACRDADVVLITDGSLGRLRKLTSVGVYVADEAHWPSVASCIDLATAKRLGLKIRLLSATIDEADLMAYLGTDAKCYTLEGRTFPLEHNTIWASPDVFKRDDTSELYGIIDGAVDQLLAEGKSALFFMGTRQQTEDAAAHFGARLPTIFLHGGVSPIAAETWVKEHDGKPWASFCTSAASTGITLSVDRSYVCDEAIETAMERGMEHTHSGPIGDNAYLQCAGRAARLRPGEAFLITHPGLRDYSAGNVASRMTPQPVVSPLRKTKANKVILAMAQQGVHADEDMDLWGSPDPDELRRARDWLVRNGCLGADGTLRPLGNLVANFPMEVEPAHLILTAPSIRAKLVLLAAFTLGLQGTFGLVKSRPCGKSLAEAQMKNPDFRIYPEDCLVPGSVPLSLARLMAKTVRMETRQLVAYCDANNLWAKSLMVARKDFMAASDFIFKGGAAQGLAATDFDDPAFIKEVHDHLKRHAIYRSCKLYGDTEPGAYMQGKFDAIFALAFGYTDDGRSSDGKPRLCWSIPSVFKKNNFAIRRLEMAIAEDAIQITDSQDEQSDTNEEV